jgi:hypothetical protein
VATSEEKAQLGTRRRWKYNIKIVLEEVRWGGCGLNLSSSG